MSVTEPTDLLPLQPLLDHLAVSVDELGRECGVSATTVRAAKATGLTASKAKAWCHHAGVDFDEVWHPDGPPAKLKVVDDRPTAEPVAVEPVAGLPVLPDGIEWVDDIPAAPERNRGPGRISWPVKLAPMRRAPGRWAQVAVVETAKKANQRKHHMRKSLGPDFDVEVRELDIGHAIYVRFTGEAA